MSLEGVLVSFTQVKERFSAYMGDEHILKPDVLFSNLFAGFLVAVIGLTFGISTAALVFSGPLTPYLSAGIGVMLIPFVVSGLGATFLSTFPGIVVGPRSGLIPVLVLMGSSITDIINTTGQPEQILPTVIASILLSTLLTGVFLWILGTFKIGVLIRYIPYPVMGGVFAGISLWLIIGGISMTAGIPIDGDPFGHLFQPTIFMLWGSAFLFGFILFMANRIKNHWLTIPVILTVGFLLFQTGLSIAGFTHEEAQSRGWLLSFSGTNDIWPAIHPKQLADIHWGALIQQTLPILIIMFMSAIFLLLDASGLELYMERDLDLDGELRAMGMANIAGAVAGGTVSLPVAGDTILASKLRGKTRWVGVFRALFCTFILIAGPDILSFLPIPLLGGMLIFLGLNFLVEWVYDAWFKLPFVDYIQVIIILFAIVSMGLLQGVGVGVLVAAITFVMNYSRISIIKHTLSRADYASNVDRHASHQIILKKKGDSILIFVLQGFIFFGTASKLVENIRFHSDQNGKKPIHTILLDFRLVSRLDTSAIFSFSKLIQFVRTRDMQLVLTNIDDELQNQLDSIGFFDTACRARHHLFSELDIGLEWCEEQLLLAENAPTLGGTSLHELLADAFENIEIRKKLLSFLERFELKNGETLFQQGDAVDGLYFVESGTIAIHINLGAGKTKRLRSMGAGTVIGEMGLYMNAPRSAAAVVQHAGVSYKLSTKAFETMQQTAPDVATAFHTFIVRLLAQRLAHANKEIQQLLC